MEENQKKSSKGILFLILALIVVCTLCAVLTIQLLTRKESAPVQNVSLNTNAVDIQNAETEQDMIYFSGFDDVSVQLGNPVMLPCDGSNADGGIYMSYTVTDEKGKVLFESGLIEPGKAVEWIPEFTVGEYNIVFHEQPYQLADKEKDPTEDNLVALYFVDQTIRLTVTQ